MKITSVVRDKAALILISLVAAAGIAGPACADPLGDARVVRVKSTDTVIIEDGDRIIYIASPRHRGATKVDPKKRVSYEGIGTEEAIRRHNEVVGQLMDNPSRPVECR
jgi:hypothetical protein